MYATDGRTAIIYDYMDRRTKANLTAPSDGRGPGITRNRNFIAPISALLLTYLVLETTWQYKRIREMYTIYLSYSTSL